jgi:hypothetical protein
MLIEIHPALIVTGVFGLLLAICVLQPVARLTIQKSVLWVQLATTGISLTLLMPVVLVIFEQTQHFRANGLTEVGSAAFKAPPMSEAAVQAIRNVLRPGESWATVTQFGRCGDIDLYAFYWLAFRLIPNPPDCKHPDVELFLRLQPPVDAHVVDHGQDYWVVRP